MEKKITQRLVRKLLHLFGVHFSYNWQPYPNIAPDIKVKRCEICDYYEWR